MPSTIKKTLKTKHPSKDRDTLYPAISAKTASIPMNYKPTTFVLSLPFTDDDGGTRYQLVQKIVGKDGRALVLRDGVLPKHWKPGDRILARTDVERRIQAKIVLGNEGEEHPEAYVIQGMIDEIEHAKVRTTKWTGGRKPTRRAKVK